MLDITKITITYENCEVMDFMPEDFGTFLMADIHEEIHRIALNSIAKQKIAGTVAFEIFGEADTTYDSFGEESKDTKFARIIHWNDITAIDLTYDNGITEEYFVDYKEEIEGALGSPNVFQKTYVSGLGNLYIVISKEKNVRDMFPEEKTEDFEVISFRKKTIRL